MRTAVVLDTRPTSAEIEDLISCITPYLNHGGNVCCRPVSYRRKGRKRLIEFEVSALDGSAETADSCIAKVYGDERGGGVFQAQSLLWNCGLRPPSALTVVRPIAYIESRRLLLQEKAPGISVADVIFNDLPGAPAVVEQVARWVVRLQGFDVMMEPRLGKVKTDTLRYGEELAEQHPLRRRQIMELTGTAVAALECSGVAPAVPSHGDLHPKNLFLCPAGRLSAIDLDFVGAQERAADAGYFIAQTAIMGYFHFGSFAATEMARHHFLESYQQICPAPVDVRRLALYTGMAFLQSLHYELSVLRNGRTGIIEPWLDAASQCLSEGKVL